MKFGRLNFLALVCVIGASAAGLTGCGSSSSLGPGANTTSNYRVVNTLLVESNSTGAPINFALRTPATTPTTVPAYTATSYINTPAGNGVNAYAFENAAAVPTLSSSFDLQPNDYYTVLVTGVYQTNGTVTGNEGTSGIVRLSDAPPTSQLQSNGVAQQNAAIRIFNAMANGPTIYVSNDTSGSPVDIAGFNGIAYAHDSSSVNNNNPPGLTNGYLVIPANGTTAYTLTARAGSYTGQALLSISNLVPQAGSAYTIVFTGSALSADNLPLKAVILTDPLH